MKIAHGLFYCSLSLVLCLPSNAQWQRIVITDKGGSKDIPLPHPLRYWTDDPFLRDEPNDFCFGCHLENGHAVTKKDYTSDCHTLDLGTVANYTVKEFRCHFAGSPEVSSIFSTEDYKFILVGVGNSQYREIYHLQVYG